MYEDYFDIKLNDGRNFRWKNFGQVITIDNEDIRKRPMNVSGAIIKKERFENIEVLKNYEWFVNSKVFYGEPDAITFRLPADEIYILINHTFDSRLEQYPDYDYYDWVAYFKLYNDFVKRLGSEDKALTYLTNWRRPKLKTNGAVKAVVYHNSAPAFVGMLNAEKKLSVIDAFYRMIYYLQFMSGETDVR